MYARIRAMESELLQGVADKATIARLEKEVVSATSSIAQKDAEIKQLKEKIEADKKEHQSALNAAEFMAGEQAYYYGELLMAYIEVAYPDLDFADPEFNVPEPDEVRKLDKVEDLRGFLRTRVQKLMKRSAEEGNISTSSPNVNEELVTDGTVPAEGVSSVEKEVPPAGVSPVVEMDNSQASVSGAKNVEEDTPAGA
ncbi:uncharacterized protein [Euphorbia lathyris]|uniref:uncharacterized protein n=1 Tax=Euphorbia lathyris TaxID=212925 RepID=UPI003313D7A5